MVTLVVATTTDPASLGPASALLAFPGWHSGPSFQGVRSFVNGDVIRLLQHDKSIVEEDDLDSRITFNFCLGVPHLQDGDVLPQGGKPGWAALPSPRMVPWLILLKKLAESRNLVPEFEVTLEATHHGPVTNKPTMFVEIGSTEEYWRRQDAAQVIAQLVWEGLGLGGGDAVGNWSSNSTGNKVLLGIGGGHYAPRHMDIVLKGGICVGHLLSGYSLPMEDPSQSKADSNIIGGTWREAIKVAFEATKAAFPGGEILAHLDQKSFKSWQKNAIMGFLEEQNIKIGKPGDFF
ncbi:hypothetical protein RJ639_027096 [Escallonia herrerae]|uniref:D-aminoacyl-tRNA deacylase n=1 Tax=Escallonia herrerae TaxID=1293975 RepID=A0AA88X4I4_9ASTE|nr:hypothetical protein RJ639_027096 [Escallonia herrerae]